MRVLLVYPDFLESKGGTAQHGSYSEGLASLSAVLKSQGHQVALMHLTRPAHEREYLAELASYQPDLVGFNSRTSVFPYVRQYALWTKQYDDIPTVCGGYHATLVPQETLDTPGIDAVCIGEGEHILAGLCRAVEQGEDWSQLPGVWTRCGGQMVRNPVAPLVEDLDTLPLPDFSLFDYRRLAASQMSTALVMLSRGCPYNCAYCCNHGLRKVYPNPARYTRFRSPERSIVYLEQLRTSYPGLRYLNFMDDILPLNREWFSDFISRYRREVGLPFSCRLRANLVDRDVVCALKEAGCYLVHMGVETGDEELRRAVLNRPISQEQLVKAFDTCRDLDMSTLAYNMINLPGETVNSTLSTIRLNARLRPQRMVVSIFYPYPGTDLHRLSWERGWLSGSDYQSDMPLKQPGYGSAQVWFMHRYFKSLVRVYQLLYRLPHPAQRACRGALEAVLCSPLLPRRSLAVAADAIIAVGVGLKRFLMKHFPAFYLRLRDRVVGRVPV
ncbi:MAG: radical SAM protein [Bacillota bacterium]